MNRYEGTIKTIASLLLLTIILTSTGPLRAATGDPTPAQPVASASQAVGRELLLNMARFLAGLEGLTVTVRSGYDVLQPDGQMIQFLERRLIALQRPGQLRVDETGARAGYVLFDGDNITVYDATERVFAQAPQPGTIDDALVYFTRELGMRLPLAVLASTRLPLELDRRVRAVDYVEASWVFDEPVHQVVARTDQVDFQVWIADGDEPWPRRVVLDYHDEPGRPQFWAEFDDWQRSPRFHAKDFRFISSPEDRRIIFAAQLTPPPTVDTGNGAGAKGEPQ